MNNKLVKVLLAVLLCAAVAVPAAAVFNEKDLGHTLSVLRFELREQYSKKDMNTTRYSSRNDAQHVKMVDMLKKCNELSLILYSQNQDFTFDMTYALEEVTRQYEEYNRDMFPYEDIVNRLDLEIDRYQRLVESLRRLPPVLDRVEEVPDSLVISTDSLLFQLDKASRNDADGVPFVLDEHGQEDRDSCLVFARGLLRRYVEQREMIIQDQAHYREMSSRLKESYDYAQERYKLLQKRIFIEGQDNYLKILASPLASIRRAWQDVSGKYGNAYELNDDGHHHGASEWRGPIVSGFIFIVIFLIALSVLVSMFLTSLSFKHSPRFRNNRWLQDRKGVLNVLLGIVIFTITIFLAGRFTSHNFISVASSLLLIFSWLIIADLASMLIRLSPDKLADTMKLYLPIELMGLIVITFRVIFIPNSAVNLIYPPLLLCFSIWQNVICMKKAEKVERIDKIYGWLSLVIMGVSTLVAFYGYVMMSIQLFVWWLFQLAAIQTVTAVYDLLDKYEGKFLHRKLLAYKLSHKSVNLSKKESFIQITWFYDFIKMAAVPVAAILSLPLSIWMASSMFDLKEVCKTIFFHPFFDFHNTSGEVILHLSLFKIVLVASLYYFFNYINYAVKAFYRLARIEHRLIVSGKEYVQTNEVNLTLANNVISILVWGVFITVSISLLKIPVGALSLVAAGLATGIGLAMKDVLNNFIYGIQLMAGRVRVGDWIECDGVRGKVDGISYQSTQIETNDGAIMSITNTTLFNEKFKNLTKNNSYELVRIPVGVAYGTDVENVRKVILDALEKQKRVDKYGRHIVKEDYGIVVAVDKFGDSSVDLVVKQYVVVSEIPSYSANAKEIIYNAFNESGIEIPFPQCDVHMK